MAFETVLPFAAAMFPLVLTPGPDMLFICAQALARGNMAALKANGGVMAGYVTHAMLAISGVSALIALWPALLELLRWAGIAYIAYLALRLIGSAFQSNETEMVATPAGKIFVRGWATALLNPKTFLVFLVILPSFTVSGRGFSQQATLLSMIFIALCGSVYGAIGFGIARANRRAKKGKKSSRSILEGGAGFMLLYSALSLARA